MAQPATPNRTGNRLLDRLPENEYTRLFSSWETVSLPHGHEICRQNGPMSQALSRVRPLSRNTHVT